MASSYNNIKNNTENFTHKQKQGFYCQTSNFYCSMPEIKKDISTIDSKLKPLYDFLQGTGLISLNLIRNVSFLLGEDEELVKNAKCISFYNKKTCESIEFLHQVGFMNILYGIRDLNEFLEDENYYEIVGDYLDSIYGHLTEFITMFEKDIDNYEIHIVPKEGIKETVVKQFANVEYEVEKHIFEYVVKQYDLIINVESKFFAKKHDSTYKKQVLEALSKTCEFIASKISFNEHLEGIFSCSKIVQFEKKPQKKPAEQDIKIKGENTFYLQQLKNNSVLSGNNLTSIGGESKNQTPVSTEIMVIGVSFVIVSFLFGIIYLVYNYFMKKRELKERRQCSDRIELVVHCDADDIELN